MNEPVNPEVVILNTALELRPVERSAYLDQACAGNATLRQRVEELIQAHERAEDFLTAPPAGRDLKRTMLLNVLPTEKPGDKIGHYKLLQQIGEGGCGVVYMAEQEEPVRRRVALKVIKLGMDTKEVIARFEAERQALALMDHPNIAKVLDAGATRTGRPYFVMELVRGTKITDYCDENKVSTEERLKLFIQVCQAIQHAHQKGIIHRDIKPSNILVTVNDGVPVPKVIDFGIAKATQGRLTDKTLFTAFDQFIGTPAYMSPEQAVMTSLDIDTRSDIYSLGVLLYELLTGKTPFDANDLLQAGFDAMRRTIREIEPPKPSTRLSTMLDAERTVTATHRHTDPPKLMHLVRGDLDWIVMKSLEKDRARRYETANGFAADIQRHLNCEPVVARPPSKLYEFQKTVRRHKFGFAAATALITVLAAGVIVSTSEAIRATHAERDQVRLRQIAETKEKKSGQVAQFLTDMLKGVTPSVALGRDTTMLHEIVDKTIERASTDLKDQPEVEIDIRLTLVRVYNDLQDYRMMEQTARETLRLAQAYFGEGNVLIADAEISEGSALVMIRKADEAESVLRQGIAMEKKLRGAGSVKEALGLLYLGGALRHQNAYHADMSKLVEGEACLRQALKINRNQLGNDNDDVGWDLYELATILGLEGKITEAISTQEEALAIRLKIHGEEHPFTADDYHALANLLGRSTNRLNEAADYAFKGLDILKRMQGEGKFRQVWGEHTLGGILSKQGKLEQSELHYRTAVKIMRTEMGPDASELPWFILELTDVLHREGKLLEARTLDEEAVAICVRRSDHVEHASKQDALIALKAVLQDLSDTNALGILNITSQTNAAPYPSSTQDSPAR